MRSLRVKTSSSSKRNAGQLAHLPRRPACEFLENRCLLSVSVGDDGYSREEFDAVGTYEGEVRLRRADDEGRRTYDVTLTIDSQDQDGRVSGTFSGDFGQSTFADGDFSTAPKWARHLNLDLDGDFDGTFDAHFAPRNDDRIEGGLRDAENRKFGSIRLTQVDDGGGTDRPAPNPTPTPTPSPTTPPTGTQPTGSFPAAGSPGFAVREVNAEDGVTVGTLADAGDLLIDGDIAAQAGDPADADDADAIAHYGVQQLDFGTPGGSAAFQTVSAGGDDHFALAAAGAVDVVEGTSMTTTVGLQTTGAARLFVNGVQVAEVLDSPGSIGTSGVQLENFTLNDGDRIEVVYAETDSPAGSEQLYLYALTNGTDTDGDGIADPGTQQQVALGSTESGVLITVPEVSPGSAGGIGDPTTGADPTAPTPAPTPTDPTNPDGFPSPNGDGATTPFNTFGTVSGSSPTMLGANFITAVFPGLVNTAHSATGDAATDGSTGFAPPAGPGVAGSGPGVAGSGPGVMGSGIGVGDIPGSPGVGEIPSPSNSPLGAGIDTSASGVGNTVTISPTTVIIPTISPTGVPTSTETTTASASTSSTFGDSIVVGSNEVAVVTGPPVTSPTVTAQPTSDGTLTIVHSAG